MNKLPKLNDLKGMDYFLTPSLAISTAFFITGIIVNIINYIPQGRTFAILIEANGIILLTLIYLLCYLKKIHANKAIMFHVLVNTINICIRMIEESSYAMPDSSTWIQTAMCISYLPLLFAGMTTFKWLPFCVAGTVTASYATASLIMNDNAMLLQTPVYALLLFGLSSGYSYILRICRAIERDNLRISNEQENILNYFYFTPAQWEKIKQGRMDRDRFETILGRMEKTEKEKVVEQAKKVFMGEADIKETLRNRHSGLSSGDMDLCCLIIRGYSVSEIARLQSLQIQSITSRRSRLRTKIGLKPGEDLKDYLNSLVLRVEG